MLIFLLIDYYSYFNPRPREEGDSYLLSVVPEEQNFNPRPREEGDP